ncbi:MAG: NADH:flavin oxidoreductase [Deltaproteobacteria bacterium]|nr:NADH:flavin oxidoreductase [Deltaproteobacteria bacterium]
MYKPPERIKHVHPDGGWPTAGVAAASRWFSPVEIGALTLRTRTWVPAMVPWRASDEGFVTPEVLSWYGRFAQGRPGAIVVEATGIRDVPSGPLLRIGHDRFVPGLRALVETVRRESDGHTRLFVQLIDFLTIRRRPEPATYFRRHLVLEDHHRRAVPQAQGDAAVREALLAMPDHELASVLTARELESLRMGFRERVTDLHLPHIRALPQQLPVDFAAAAVRAQAAGFDGVELHYAHAYTMASLLSRRNDRDDGHGGSREGRLRAPLEVFAAVRTATAPSFAVGCRFLADECIEGGSDVDDATAYALAFARAGMDFLSLSRGGKFEDAQQPKPGAAAYPYTGRSGHECMPTVLSDAVGPFGRNLAAAATIKAALVAAGERVPLVVTGGNCSFAQAESILAAGHADVVGAARQSLADPDWFLKVELGRGDAVRRCKFTNYCEALDQQHKPVTCQLWDRSTQDDGPDVPMTTDGRRRLIAPRWQR